MLYGHEPDSIFLSDSEQVVRNNCRLCAKLSVCCASDNDIVFILFLTTMSLSLLLVLSVFLLVLLLRSYISVKKMTTGRYEYYRNTGTRFMCNNTYNLYRRETALQGALVSADISILFLQFTRLYCILYLTICFRLHTKYRKKALYKAVHYSVAKL